MDISSVLLVGGGLAVGWCLRSLFPEKPEVLPCRCDCHCVSSLPEHGSSYLAWGVLAAILIGLGAVVANFALAVKFSVINRGPGKEIAFQVKGRSKGVYNPPSALQLTD